MKTQEKIDVLEAHRDGKEIEFVEKNSYLKWEIIKEPEFNFTTCLYRVKLEMKEI